jgi:G3E family GTPase
MMRRQGPLPVRIVTGFLGSGKTTLVNHVLRQTSGSDQRVGVIVNEFGPVSIDDRLIRRESDDIVELSNGCVCCTMQRDLMETLTRLLNLGHELDSVLIETTGLADPVPLMSSLMQPEIAAMVELAGVVTVVDALNFDANLEQAAIAHNQLAAADALLLNKADLVDDDSLEAMERGLGTLNPTAVVTRCVQSAVDLELVLALSVDRSIAVARDPDHASTLENFASVGFAIDEPLSLSDFEALSAPSLNITRGKGVLLCKDVSERVIFQRVGSRTTMEREAPWPENLPPRTEIVLIGPDLDRQALLDHMSVALGARVEAL